MPAVSSRAILLSHSFLFLYPVLQDSVYHPGGDLRLCSNAGMGFFSSRKPYDDYVTTDKSVVHVIRSRFYGKNKGKEREAANPTFVDTGKSAAQTLAQPSPIHANGTDAAAVVSLHKKTGPRPRNSVYGQPGSSAEKSATNMPAPSPLRKDTNDENDIAVSLTRKATDSVTVTLAQRLNELAVANSEGLLNDDEYRMLRQSLFERFATSSTVPSEEAIVPVNRHQARGNESSKRLSASSRPSSNFVVTVPRSPSVQSRNSIASGMAGLFRRPGGNRTRSGSKDVSDTSSVFSSTSSSSNIFKLPQLIKKSSASSVASAQTEASRPTDTISLSSRRTGLNEHPSMPHLPSSRSTASSIRRYATPPSAFPGARVLATDPKYSGTINDVFDEGAFKSSEEIKQEMAAVESERKRLMDAFHGLEVTALTKKHHQRQGKIHEDSSVRDASTWTLIPDSRSQQRLALSSADSDVTSIRSGTSINTTYTGRRVVRQKTTSSLATSSRPGSLHRKNSVSSVSSGRATGTGGGGLAPPPVPSLPMGMSLNHGYTASGSSINLTRSAGQPSMRSVPEDEIRSVAGRSVSDRSGKKEKDEMEEEMVREMEDIRRRREEVSMRYEARLEYLRAKLKGAQLHEKLMKK
ncbi:hypothetical protein IW261DRAFT_1448918 [Armillaria novae-zelandiae]|uniref:Uncharacterized protein n=1 Tax=Armillaria novae-zelandiae TaxID=153914 RepID=A0AA39PNN6_9AGAR|nr:hypothetical protein IW261DRAFT_1448918 [Armillaria novae-zelandiae]